MKNIIDLVCENEMICEAFKDPRIYQAWKTLQRYNISWKDLFRWHQEHIAWDKVDKRDIVEYDKHDIEKLLKIIRRRKKGGDEEPFILLGFRNELLVCAYDAEWSHAIAFFNAGYKSSYDKSDKIPKGSADWRSMDDRNPITQKEQFDYLRDCDYILKVNIARCNTYPLSQERKSNREGAWMLTQADHESHHLSKGVLGKSRGGRSDSLSWGSFYDMCNKMAEKAVERWKKIVAERKFERSQDTSKIDDAVEGIMMRITKATRNATKNPEKYKTHELEDLMKSVYDKYSYSGSGRHGYTSGRDALLKTYSDYCQIVMDLKKGNSYNVTSAVTKKENLEVDIMNKVAVCDGWLKKFDA